MLYRYNVTAEIADATATRVIVSPDTFVTKISGISCEKIFQQNYPMDRKILPQELQSCKNKNYLLHLQLAKKSTPSDVSYAAIDFTVPKGATLHSTTSTPPPSSVSTSGAPESSTSTAAAEHFEASKAFASEHSEESKAKRQLTFEDQGYLLTSFKKLFRLITIITIIQKLLFFF